MSETSTIDLQPLAAYRDQLGVSLSELSEQSAVLLIFLRHTG